MFHSSIERFRWGEKTGIVVEEEKGRGDVVYFRNRMSPYHKYRSKGRKGKKSC